MLSNNNNRHQQHLKKTSASYASTAFSPYLITTTNTVYSTNHPQPQIKSQTNNLKSCSDFRNISQSNKTNHCNVSDSNENLGNISVNSIINSKLTFPGPVISLSRRTGHHHFNSAVGRSYSLNLKHDRPFIHIQSF